MEQRTVLVVDDDAAVRALMVEVLDEAGYAVLEADCGRQALELVRQRVPAVVLLDQRLPDMSGLDVLKWLRSRAISGHIPIILVSGIAYQLADVDHGADRVLPKPFDIDELLDMVNALTCPVQDGLAYPDMTVPAIL